MIYVYLSFFFFWTIGLTQLQQQDASGSNRNRKQFHYLALASVNRTKTTNNMEKQFFVFNVAMLLQPSEGRISSLSGKGIEMINTKHSLMGNYIACLTGNYIACLTGKWCTPRPWIFISFQGLVSTERFCLTITTRDDIKSIYFILMSLMQHSPLPILNFYV